MMNHLGRTALAVCLITSSVLAAERYELVQNYEAKNFFEGFDFVDVSVTHTLVKIGDQSPTKRRDKMPTPASWTTSTTKMQFSPA